MVPPTPPDRSDGLTRLPRLRPAADGAPCPAIVDPDALADRLEDASATRGGHASLLLRPADPAKLSAWLSADPATRVTTQGSRSSLTGGATPFGGAVVDTSAWLEFEAPAPNASDPTVRCGAGMRLDDLRARLAELGWDYPPVPTYAQATVGGVVSTNAAGPSTFKYGQTRGWVRALELLLADGRRLEIARGEECVPAGGHWTVAGERGAGVLDVPHPGFSTPSMKKISAGIFSSDPLDPIDLFVGSEGTLAVVTAATLAVVPRPAGVFAALLFAPNADAVFAASTALRRAAAEARRSSTSPTCADLRAVEFIDGHGLRVLREDAPPPTGRLPIPDGAGAALTLEIEWTGDLADAEQALVDALEGRGDRALAGCFSACASVLDVDSAIVALPGDEETADAIRAFREAVPLCVNERARRRPSGEPGEKRAADPAVPPNGLPGFYAFVEYAFASRGVPFAVWGHCSDGNLHPNAMPRSDDEDRRAGEAIDALSAEAVRLGGTPLAEHGVGRHPSKQRWLADFLGTDALDGMRRVKRALDPAGRLSPGVLWPEHAP